MSKSDEIDISMPSYEHIDQSILTRELWFAWLLRSDVRGFDSIKDTEAQKNFICWWIMHGRWEYPGAPSINKQQIRIAEEISEQFFSPIPALPITRLMAYCLKVRHDLQEAFPLQSSTGLLTNHSPSILSDNSQNQYTLRFLAWYYVCGVTENRLVDICSQQTLEALNAPSDGMVQDAPVPITFLMHLVWWFRQDVQSSFDLSNNYGRRDFTGWFYLFGIREHNLYALVSIEQCSAIFSLAPSGDCTFLMLLARERFAPILKELDLSTDTGRQSYDDWLATEGELEFELSKLRATPPPTQTKPTKTVRKKLPEGINLIGHANGELGIGEDIRMAALSLESVGIPHTIVNFPPGLQTRQQDGLLDRKISDRAIYRTNIFCLTGFDTARVLLERGADIFQGRYNIGYWPWELPFWPDAWTTAYSLVDEIWSSTRFTQSAFQKNSPVPVLHMPMAVSVARMARRPRSYFGLPDSFFLFLFVFDFNSYLARKNPFAVVEAFKQAFPDSHNRTIGLVIKTMYSDGQNDSWREFEAECRADSRIILMQTTLDRGDVLGLVQSCDAYVSLHRSEGFGRTLAEAMLLGKPVIATDYSGNTDFLTPETGFPVPYKLVEVKTDEYPFGAGAHWAEPDTLAAADCFREVSGNYKEVMKRLGPALARTQVEMSPQRIGETYLRHLRKLPKP